jgi:putative acetyltransferase
VADCAARSAEIAEITRGAFLKRFGSGDGEVALIAALRRDGDVVIELAALEAGAVVGHAMFSAARATPPVCRIAALAPVCARVDRQGQGIGESLIRAGLDTCAAKGIAAVVVLGDPAYYGRFGFGPTPLGSPYAGPHFQALELKPGALSGVRAVAYAHAFDGP